MGKGRVEFGRVTPPPPPRGSHFPKSSWTKAFFGFGLHLCGKHKVFGLFVGYFRWIGSEDYFFGETQDSMTPISPPGRSISPESTQQPIVERQSLACLRKQGGRVEAPSKVLLLVPMILEPQLAALLVHAWSVSTADKQGLAWQVYNLKASEMFSASIQPRSVHAFILLRTLSPPESHEQRSGEGKVEARRKLSGDAAKGAEWFSFCPKM